MSCSQVFGLNAGILFFGLLFSGQLANAQQYQKYDIQSRSTRGIEFDNRVQTRSTRPAGPQWGGDRSSPFNDGEPNPGQNLADFFNALDKAIKSQPKPQPQYIPQPQYPRPQPQYPRSTSQYRPVPPPTNTRPVERAVAPKANAKPPEKKNAIRANAKAAAAVDLSLTSPLEAQLLNQVVEQAAYDKLTELSDKLGNAIKVPDVAKIVEEGRERIKNGELLDSDWQDRLRDAVNNASGNPNTQLPQGTDSKELETLVTQLAMAMESNSFLKGTGNGGLTGNLGGMSNVIFVPVLPADDLLMTPNGTVILGTGGEGTLQSASLSTADVLGMPVGAGEPEPESAADFSKRIKSGILLTHPQENAADINYVLGNNSYTMKPGYTHTLAEGQKWVIRFNRGENFGEASYTLSDGTYAFGSSAKGWELYRTAISVTIDNSDNESAFFYNIDNDQVEVEPGQTKTHKSNYPIFVRFDRGDGGKELQKKIHKKDYNLKVAVDPKDGFWNLYPSAEAPEPTPGMGIFATSEPAKDKSRLARLRALMSVGAQ